MTEYLTGMLVAVFAAGYLLIACEHWTRVNKAAVALLTGVAAWTLLMVGGEGGPQVVAHLADHLSDTAGILFFLLGAMTIVELIDAHAGFQVLLGPIRQSGKRRLLVVVALATFFLSAVLDNLTTTIVAISILRKLVADRRDRMLYAGMVVIAANAGGAWTVIGDVTTTMLWIGGQVTTVGIMRALLLPSLVCLAVSVLLIAPRFRGALPPPAAPEAGAAARGPSRAEQLVVLIAGIAGLLLVPVFKALTHLPPYMGMLLSLGLLWTLTEFLHRGKEQDTRHAYSVAAALRRIDTTVILFFLGILLCIAALQTGGVLESAGRWLAAHLRDERLIVVATGLVSAVVDNVPLVAALQRMYTLAQYPADHLFWELLAYCAGTGGSILIIGSAAGVAAMGMENLDFWWYLRRIGWIALVGYLAGVACYVLLYA